MNICVYGASSTTLDESYLNDAEKLGAAIAGHGFGLVFGGGVRGMMGAAARGAKSAGGRVIGVAPSFFKPQGVLYDGCDEFIYTETMRERKQKMEELSDGFIVMPGGIGTFEEFFEIFTLRQLGRHEKPIALLNTNGYYNSLSDMLVRSCEEHFLREESLAFAPVLPDVDSVLKHVMDNLPQ